MIYLASSVPPRS